MEKGPIESQLRMCTRPSLRLHKPCYPSSIAALNHGSERDRQIYMRLTSNGRRQHANFEATH
ncbi:hypothetical protein TCAL_04962 [Tigriopus californicus]|uniref:Uncharacterized protein n=1 Tax=Tigriopus californicus TaxID=6832 RepID=A0A553PBB4_TIGCA|nr:hypothetical protein TCAL_04962 [Tigriopus californicus]|eukprot:TCALIF_04962-PA protein Name:"Protein of unknown function" AED:0.28 eAED:0.39 QI:61/0/0.5/1/0/0.5/2/39/61